MLCCPSVNHTQVNALGDLGVRTRLPEYQSSAFTKGNGLFRSYIHLCMKAATASSLFFLGHYQNGQTHDPQSWTTTSMFLFPISSFSLTLSLPATTGVPNPPFKNSFQLMITLSSPLDISLGPPKPSPLFLIYLCSLPSPSKSLCHKKSSWNFDRNYHLSCEFQSSRWTQFYCSSFKMMGSCDHFAANDDSSHPITMKSALSH